MLFKKTGSTRNLNAPQTQCQNDNKTAVKNSFKLVKTVSRRDLKKKLETEDKSD
jgi:hypothetical protein